jgi:methyltransferase (TIGR00027 family)
MALQICANFRPVDATHTAAAIARVRRLEGELPSEARLFDDPYATLFDDARVDVQQLFEMVPFFVEHVRIRTRFIDDAVREAVTRGVRDVVLIGAGFDTRALRMSELRSGVRVVEIDHAEQIAEKKRRFAAAGVALPDGLVFAPADLGEDGALAGALTSAGLRAAPDASTVLWICEGLFGYLGKEALRTIAANTARFSAPRSTLVANHFTPWWSSSALEEVFVPEGWHVSSAPPFEALHRRWLGPSVPPGSEPFALLVATRS